VSPVGCSGNLAYALCLDGSFRVVLTFLSGADYTALKWSRLHCSEVEQTILLGSGADYTARKCYAAGCLELCVYIERHIKGIRPFKQMHMTVNALPQLPSATQQSPIFLSGDCKAAYIAYSAVRVGRRNLVTRRDQTWRAAQAVQHTSTLPV
jgi:hypothetical protein